MCVIEGCVADCYVPGFCKKHYLEMYNAHPIVAARKKAYREKSKAYILNKKIKVLSYYSKNIVACACCGETHIEFLAIDHVNNDGAKHRKEINGGLYSWLKKNHYPPGFQVLCFNCNWAKAHGGCPHQKEREQHEVSSV